MENISPFFEDGHISKRHWAVAVGSVVKYIIESSPVNPIINPTEEEISIFVKGLTDRSKAVVFDAAKEHIEQELSLLQDLAEKRYGFSREKSLKVVKKVLALKYKKLENDPSRNFKYLDNILSGRLT